MGIFDFLKGAGRKVDESKVADDIRDNINRTLGNQVQGLNVRFDDGTVHLSGMVDYHSTKQKAVLLAGNVNGVEKVDDSGLTVKPLEVHRQEATEHAAKQGQEQDGEYTFYTIQQGDTLSAISKRYYGDANKWRELHQANQGVIDDPDKIYPGQTIRVPAKANV